MHDQLHFQAYLAENDFINGRKMIDSVDVKNTCTIEFSIPEAVEPGLLTLYFYSNVNGKNSKAEVHLLYESRDIELQTCISAFEDSLRDVSEHANRQYLSFVNRKKHYESYLQTLITAWNQTPESDDFRDVLAAQTEKTATEQKQFFNAAIGNAAPDMASKMIRWQLQSVLYKYEQPEKEKLKETFLQRFDFADPLLQRSNLLETIAQSFMFLYREEGMDAGSQQDQAIIAITRLMDALSVNPDVSAGMASLFARDFMQAGLDNIALFVQESWLANQEGCVNSRTHDEILADMDALKKIQPGNMAPEIILRTEEFNCMSEITSEITVVIFWADWCSHCRRVLPQYHAYLEKADQVSVIAIALDEGDTYQQKAMKDFPGWIHLQATGKWDDPLVKQYAIHATPTAFILDSDKTILAKVKNPAELRQTIEHYLEKIQFTQRNQ
ncbi:MAG: thioredoxin family protein [Bacteroidales bacterium]|nr:thioredoxin family protein [Bacteroidales bacterium]